jgi:Holliday junction resolvase RusA-like endonuclease
MPEKVFSVRLGGVAVPFARPRWDGRNRRAYNTPRYDNWKHSAAVVLATHWRRPPIERAVEVAVDVVLPRPKTKPGAGSVHRDYWTEEGAYPLPCRSDVDNLAKAALDALQDARVILDDRLVVRLLATKQAGDRPGVTVTVSVVMPGESIL